MNGREALEVLARRRSTEPVITFPGINAAMLRELGHHDPLVMPSGGMAYALPSCLGLALARPDLRVIAVEGDGSLIAGLGGLTTLARYAPPNLTVLAIDNGVYLSAGLATAASFGADLCALGRAAGLENSLSASTPEELDQHLARALREEGPYFIVARVDQSKRNLAPHHGRRLDRTADSVMFAHAIGSRPNVPVSTTGRCLDLHPSTEGPGKASGRAIYQALKTAGVDLVLYVPDSITRPIQELAEADREMLTLCCSREDEGLVIASGAYLGGITPAILLEGSGVGYSALALSLCMTRRTPVLVVASHPQSLGCRHEHDANSWLVAEPLFRALNLSYAALRDVGEAAQLIRESVLSMDALKAPVGVLIPPYVMSEGSLRTESL